MRDLGLMGFVTFQLAVGGSVLAAVVHPLFVALLISAWANGKPWFGAGTEGALFITTLVAGYLTTVLIGLHGLAKRGLLKSAWALIFVPLHWVLLSLAAWRAIYQFIFEPHRWEKTEHGLARSSRLADMAGDAPRGERSSRQAA
jgi:hypothetical protein